MPTLDPTLREQLATVIGKEKADDGARAVAGAGALAALSALAVPLAAPHSHLDDGDKHLRNRLRARARQLGDKRHGDGKHAVARLVEQVAYEHWHRMLFARFLAENDLLIHPGIGVAVTLEECAELASSEGADDGWELAGRYASGMLPQIFRPDDPVLAVKLPAEHQHELELLLASLPGELFRASDSLGWCYQFWQARRKKEVNESEVKIGADELPAVTQLFTEPYMVQFLLHNTLGAWWVGAGRDLPVDMPYLRQLDDGMPAAGTFEGWPRLVRELKVLDPCCGSGHFLVEAFLILVAFRMAEEGLSARDACDAVLRDNLFGLEIDARCVQIAAFALALAAWTFPGAGGHRPLAAMNVACSGLAISAKKEEWERLGGDNIRLRNGMGRMWELFSDAPVLGSLIDPSDEGERSLVTAGAGEVADLLSRAMRQERDPEDFETAVAAQGIAKAGAILVGRYSLIATNVPYLTRTRQSESLMEFCEERFRTGRADLATSFILRLLRLTARSGTCAVVAPQNWLFLTSYAGFRRGLLRSDTLNTVAWLGEGAFASSQAAGAFVALVVISSEAPRDDTSFLAIRADETRVIEEKASALATGGARLLGQRSQYGTPDSRITYDDIGDGQLLSSLVDSCHGQGTFDDPCFSFAFWELPAISGGWVRQQTTTPRTQLFAGATKVLRWEGGRGLLARQMELKKQAGYSSGKWKAGVNVWGRPGVLVSQMRQLCVSLYLGHSFDANAAALIPHNPRDLAAIWAFCKSPEYHDAVRKIDKKINVMAGTLAKVPIDIARWRRVAAERYPQGLPAPASTDPTQWVFNGAVKDSDAPLHVAVARLLGYRWPDQEPDALDERADVDGIVCIPALRGERPAADRVADLLAAAWGEDWHPQTLTNLLAAVDHGGTLEEWLRDSFFKQHCELFHHRPFIWHVWDGHREGFSALVNYHRLDHETLKSLTWTYLGDWIRSQQLEAEAGKSGAGDKLARAKALQKKLAAILEGQAPLDIFVRWKPIEGQPIGWHPDLDDGVRLNIRPFLMAGDVGAKGAGVLRWRPKRTKWTKDRGKNPPGSPWGEERRNDRHLKLAEKRAARDGDA